MLVAESALAWVADSAVALAVELDCMSRRAQVVSVLVAGSVVASVADSVHTSRPLLAASQWVAEWAADSVAEWVAGSAVELAAGSVAEWVADSAAEWAAGSVAG